MGSSQEMMHVSPKEESEDSLVGIICQKDRF